MTALDLLDSAPERFRLQVSPLLQLLCGTCVNTSLVILLQAFEHQFIHSSRNNKVAVMRKIVDAGFDKDSVDEDVSLLRWNGGRCCTLITRMSDLRNFCLFCWLPLLSYCRLCSGT
jgi:hypothetical protein